MFPSRQGSTRRRQLGNDFNMEFGVKVQQSKRNTEQLEIPRKRFWGKLNFFFFFVSFLLRTVIDFGQSGLEEDQLTETYAESLGNRTKLHYGGHSL